MARFRKKPPINLGFIFSLPERTIRALAASLGGMVYEATQALLPGWLRRTNLYRAIIAGLLRITVELVGDVSGVLPPDEIDAGELALRKAAGSGIEIAGLLTMGWSPLWLFAVAADLTGGTRTYLRALISELKRAGALPENAEITSLDELLDNLEDTSALVAGALDVPPLSVADLRESWVELRDKGTELPDVDRLADIYTELQQVARQENSTLLSVSTLIAAGALRAGVQVGQVHIFDYYRDALRTITKEGLPIYAMRVSKPYLAVASSHFDPRRKTYTERLVELIRGLTGKSANETSKSDFIRDE